MEKNKTNLAYPDVVASEIKAQRILPYQKQTSLQSVHSILSRLNTFFTKTLVGEWSQLHHKGRLFEQVLVWKLIL